jgi:hypothetical protein
MPDSGVVLKALTTRGVPPRAREVLRLRGVTWRGRRRRSGASGPTCIDPTGRRHLELDMTDELFREDATLLQCEATVLAVDDAGIVLDRTVFYPAGRRPGR